VFRSQVSSTFLALSQELPILPASDISIDDRPRNEVLRVSGLPIDQPSSEWQTVARIPATVTAAIEACSGAGLLDLSPGLCSRYRSAGARIGSSATRTWPVLNGCDFSVFYPRNRVDERVELDFPLDAELVLFVGHLWSSKGLRELLASVETMAQERSHLRLAIIGEGSMRPEIQAWVPRTGLSSRVILLGQCSSQQVARWINAADVFCLPSHSAGCPSAIIEALACGRPVVATEVGGIPELINDRNGLLVPPRDVKALTHTLGLALDKSWNAAVISNQFQRTWTDVAEETLAICESALYATATDRAPRSEIQSVPAAA